MKLGCVLGTLLVFVLVAAAQTAQEQKPPIIDMHLHAFPADWFGEAGLPNPATGHPSDATTDEALLRASLQALERYNITTAFASGPLDTVERWRAAAPGRVIGGPLIVDANTWPDLMMLREAYKEGRLGVFGEIGAQYMGLSLSSPEFESYLALAEELEIPVGIHTGFGPPGVTYECCPQFRGALGNPLLAEEALVRHPKLRVYLMHEGFPFIEETIVLMHAHPQVYADLAVINWVISREEFHGYLRRLMQHTDCDIPKRLMFGSDQMIWPEAIGMAIEGIESAGFLTEVQKRDIFYNNAARFLRLDD